MKHTLIHTLYIWTVLLLLPMMGCEKQYPVTIKLQQAESVMNEHPDYALRLLESISYPERLNGQEQADYALLLSLARYRCYVPATSDSLIRIAVQYYKENDDADKRGMAYYTWGGILEECATDKTVAIQAYKDAEQQIRKMKNLDVASRIYSRLGFLNQSGGNYEKAKQYYEQAIAINKKNGNNHSLASNYLNLFCIHCLANEKDSVGECTKRLLQMESALTDSALRSKIHQNLGVYQMYTGNYAEAEHHLTNALQLTSTKVSPKTWLSLAYIYQYSNRQDKSDSLYASLSLHPDMSIRANAYKHILSGLLQQSSPQLHSLFEQYTTTADSVYSRMYNAELSELQYQYEKISLEKENTRLYNRWLLSAFILLVLFITVSITFPRYYRKRQKELNDLQSSLSTLKNEKRRLLEEQSLVSEYRCSLQERETKLKSLDETIRELQNKIRRLKDNVKKMDAIKERLQISQTDNTDRTLNVHQTLMEQRVYHPTTDRIHLATFLNSLFYGFANRLSNQYSNLKERDLDICYMLALQMTADEMAKILDISTDSVKRYIRKISKEMQSVSDDSISLEERIRLLKSRPDLPKR